jgi:predicted ABC-type ATPase
VNPQAWLYIIAGPNGAGKTTLVEQLQQPGELLENIPILNPDIVAQQLLDTEHIEIAAARKVIQGFREHLQQVRTFGIETTFSGRGHLRQIREAQDRGFRVHLIFVGLDAPTTSLDRIETRVAAGGHDVPPVDVMRRYHRSMANLRRAVTAPERTSIYDNSGLAHVNVAEIASGRVIGVFDELPGWLTRALGREIAVGNVFR